MALYWTAVMAWWAAWREQRAHRRDHRDMGVCPDCGVYLSVHRLFRHGIDPAIHRGRPQWDDWRHGG